MNNMQGVHPADPARCTLLLSIRLLLGHDFQLIPQVVQVFCYCGELCGLFAPFEARNRIAATEYSVLSHLVLAYAHLFSEVSYGALEFLCCHFYAALFSSPRCCQ